MLSLEEVKDSKTGERRYVFITNTQPLIHGDTNDDTNDETKEKDHDNIGLSFQAGTAQRLPITTPTTTRPIFNASALFDQEQPDLSTARRVVIMPKDIQLARRIRGEPVEDDNASSNL